MEKHFQIMCEKAKYMVMMALLTFLAACDKGVDADETFVSDVKILPWSHLKLLVLRCHYRLMVLDWW